MERAAGGRVSVRHLSAPSTLLCCALYAVRWIRSFSMRPYGIGPFILPLAVWLLLKQGRDLGAKDWAMA